ncbi:VSP [Giardia lamblia P15]|uniref:VSP n=1 Tax=Giardia intestinalis (strain P15) TaxID=658858 RepID=E1F0N0_GIAIA|nr:VSP [Giardia lamblia P15]
MFAKLIFISLILQLTEAIRPAGRIESGNACPTLDGAGCKTCDSSSGEELCVTCKQDTDFLQLDKKSCRASCTGDGVIEDSGVNPKVCKCDADKGYQLQGGACVKGQNNACPTLDGAGCKTCDSSSGEELCVTCKQDTDFLQLDKKSCRASCTGDGVIEDSGVNPKVCKCDADKGYQLQGGACVKTQPSACKTENCQECTNKGAADEVCTKCNPTHYLTPTNQCVPDCTAIKGYYGDANEKKCKACNPECAECVGPVNSQCSACPASKALTYGDSTYPNLGGTCGDACTADKNGCKVCGAKIGGTDYCSQCSGTQVPINGVCVENASGRATLCTAKGDGTCASCAAGDLLKDGGCYKTDRLPGRSICTTASNNKCTKCANGLNADGNGVCGECHSTCATCSAAGAADKCKTCATGHYKENADNSADGTCKRCSEKIPGCKQCTSSSADSVICLESEAGTGGSVNKSGLSTGAIAGIAVAVVIVVGGLVGFLCWWFLCRGKA